MVGGNTEYIYFDYNGRAYNNTGILMITKRPKSTIRKAASQADSCIRS